MVLLSLLCIPLMILSLLGAVICFIIFIVFAATKRKKLGIGLASAICFGSFILFFCLTGIFAVNSDSNSNSSDASGSITTSQSSPESSSEPSSSEGSSRPESLVVVNQDGIKISILGLQKSYMGYEVKLLIENNSKLDITVQTRDTSINGFMIDGIISESVKVGKKANGSIDFLNSQLRDNNISSIDDLELSFHIFNSDNWDTILDTDPISVHFESK